MAFVQTTIGDRYVNLDYVGDMRVYTDGQQREIAELFAEADKLGECFFDDAAVLSMPCIPAPPGYSVLIAHIDDGDASISEQPIIAFGLGRNSATPFTIEGVPNDSQQPWAIKCPSGKVTQQGVSDYKDADAFLAAKINEYREREDKRKAEAETEPKI